MTKSIDQKDNDKQTPKCLGGGKITIIATIIITAIVAGGIVYTLMISQPAPAGDTCEFEESATATTISSLTAQQSTTESITAIDAPSFTNEDFEELINSTYADIKSNFADSVYYVLESSECCGPLSPDEAEEQLIQDTQNFAPYDFTETEQLVKNIKTNLTDLEDYKIGIAPHYNEGYLVFAYHLNYSGKVDKVYIAHSNQLDSE